MSAGDIAKKYAPKLATFALIIVAGFAALSLFRRYTTRPWTRDGQIRADVVKVAPRVSGYVVKVAVSDNQQVKAGQLLFEIDPSDYQLTVEHSQVSLDQAREDVEALEASVRAAEAMVQQSKAAVNSAQGQIEAAEAGIRSAEAVVKEAESGVTSAKAFIDQVQAELEEAQREAERAKRLADRKAGSVETAEAKAAAVKASRGSWTTPTPNLPSRRRRSPKPPPQRARPSQKWPLQKMDLRKPRQQSSRPSPIGTKPRRAWGSRAMGTYAFEAHRWHWTRHS